MAGRTLLLADDSAAVQKVIELTFADEGMEVVSVGDGQSALEKLESVRPDVVLADAFMPGLNGYELCRSIKDDQRFSQIPVMLLVSSFAPFDEAEARRAGADDIMTKPFQSIRQLVSRVGSLLGSNKPAEQLAVSESKSPAKPAPAEANVTVLVEAAPLATAESHEPSGSTCAPDLDFQTADTAHLERVADSPATTEFDAQAFEDTIEVEPQFDHAMDAGANEFAPVAAVVEYAHPTSMNETLYTPEPSRPAFNDALLDLDETDFGGAMADDDVILDLDDESPAVARSSFSAPSEAAVLEPPVAVAAQAEMPAPEPVVAEVEPEVVAEAIPSVVASPGPQSQVSADQLSPEVIEAIARRVVEHMSERVVREIAWEVVPELSELLIKRKLEEQK